MTSPTRISATMLLDSLREAQEAVDNARHALRIALDERDEAVQDCRSIRLPVSTIGRATGLSPKRINIITGHRLADASPKQYDSAAS